MSLANTFYNTIVRRNSVFVPTIFAGAFAFSIGFDVGITTFWDTWNKGVRALAPTRCLQAPLTTPRRSSGRTSVENTSRTHRDDSLPRLRRALVPASTSTVT
ncbi:ubiquinol-cytochrome C reductase [Trametes gibbosa]|nr:ubiquinol-cytochrome C reductase [Trametes gibbosa]